MLKEHAELINARILHTSMEMSLDNQTTILQEEYDKAFDADIELQQVINATNESKDLCYNSFDEPAQWSRWLDLPQYKEHKEYLENYLQEQHFMTVDWDNDCLMLGIGLDNIIINNEGDVFQEMDVIINANDYNTSEERDKLIEDHMENTGFYPSVIYQDCYGNMSYVNTKEKE